MNSWVVLDLALFIFHFLLGLRALQIGAYAICLVLWAFLSPMFACLAMWEKHENSEKMRRGS